MRALGAIDILAAWEYGEQQHPLDRALTLLAFARPDLSRAELAGLSLAERDRLLWDMREATFGPILEARVSCPECSHPLSFACRVSDLRPRGGTDSLTPARLEMSGREYHFRLPTSRDLAAVAGAADEGIAMQHLASRCQVCSDPTEGSLPPEAFTTGKLEELSRQMAGLDPGVETRLDLTCPDCSHRWTEAFDIAGFFWTELARQARRHLQEVDALARAYGWSEAEVLALSPSRREAYLKLAGS